MIAVTPRLHEIIPHGWACFSLFDPDRTVGSCYAEHPDAVAMFRERGSQFVNDPNGLLSLLFPALHAVGIGWTLHRQGCGYLESAYCREFEATLDSCWKLDAMLGDAGCTIAGMQLSRPRGARPFTADDVVKLDPLRPWLTHALRRQPGGAPTPGIFQPCNRATLKLRDVFTPDGRLQFQTSRTPMLLSMLDAEHWSLRDSQRGGRGGISPLIQKLLWQITGAASGTSASPPRMQISSAFGLLTLEAKWLMPADVLPADAAKDPNSCLIAVTIELREHAVALAARVLRESGATPRQVKVGVQLATGKAKHEIADDLGISLATVADLTRKLYQTLDVHSSAELSTRIWLGKTRMPAG
jgi:DNA-binding CsgD family transcriptional regulator